MDAESSILGAMLIDAHAVELACNLEPQDFTDRKNAELFEIMKALHEGGSVVDVVTISDVMPDVKTTWLTQMMLDTPSTVGVEDYIRIVRERRQRRDFIAGMSKVIQNAGKDESYITEAEKVLESTINLGSTDIRPASEYVDDAVASLGQAEGHGLNTGFSVVDKYMHGMKPGQLIIVAGCTRMGKTSFAMNIALNVAQHERVAVFSLEMTRKELLQRAVISIASVNEDEINQHPAAQKEIQNASIAVKNLQLYIW